MSKQRVYREVDFSELDSESELMPEEIENIWEYLKKRPSTTDLSQILEAKPTDMNLISLRRPSENTLFISKSSSEETLVPSSEEKTQNLKSGDKITGKYIYKIIKFLYLNDDSQSYIVKEQSSNNFYIMKRYYTENRFEYDTLNFIKKEYEKKYNKNLKCWKEGIPCVKDFFIFQNSSYLVYRIPFDNSKDIYNLREFLNDLESSKKEIIKNIITTNIKDFINLLSSFNVIHKFTIDDIIVRNKFDILIINFDNVKCKILDKNKLSSKEIKKEKDEYKKWVNDNIISKL